MTPKCDLEQALAIRLGVGMCGEGSAVALKVSLVSHAYGGLQALSEVSMTVRRGEFRVLLGANGAGKTTLLSLLTSDNACNPPYA